MKSKIDEGLELFQNNPVINWHEHVWESEPGVLNELHLARLVDAAQKTGMDRLLCSTPLLSRYCPPEDFCRANHVVAEAMRRYPELIRGMCFVNPGYRDAALKEIDHCVQELGMVGVKLYHQYFLDDPVQFPIIEKCIELDIPLLMHASMLTHNRPKPPHVSYGTHFAAVARRYPQANLIMAHIGGGGDWQWSLKEIAPYPNIVLDISGSVYDREIIEESVSYVGAERILFATDGSISAGIGKLLAARIPEKDKKRILSGGRYSRFLERVERGYAH